MSDSTGSTPGSRPRSTPDGSGSAPGGPDDPGDPGGPGGPGGAGRRPAPEPFVVPDVAAWRAWLDAHEDASDGVWLVLAKKGTIEPTSLTYQQALDEALCSGWIDGQKKAIDAATFLQRFTPRRRRSLWSARNVGLVAELTAAGRMRPRGLAEVSAAQADGRWDRAYPGSAGMEVPEDLATALAASPVAAATFATYDRADRYAVLHRITTAHDGATRARRLGRLVEMLEQGGAPHEQGGAPHEQGGAPHEQGGSPSVR